MKILIPKDYYEIEPEDCPLFYLAGPVRGADDWQKTCVELLEKHLGRNFCVAIPYYHKDNKNFPLVEKAEVGKKGLFERQLDWERHYMEQAAHRGCLLFWLPEESKTNPRKEGPYAADTRGEVARWSVELRHAPLLSIAFGGEAGFYGIDQIKRNLNADQGYTHDFGSSLEETVAFAVDKARYRVRINIA